MRPETRVLYCVPQIQQDFNTSKWGAVFFSLHKIIDTESRPSHHSSQGVFGFLFHSTGIDFCYPFSSAPVMSLLNYQSETFNCSRTQHSVCY
jgi:hypothetical protein